MPFKFSRSCAEELHGQMAYSWTITYRPKPIAITASFEDDAIAISAEYGNCFRSNGGMKAFNRARFLHSFTLYRWYRAVLRWFSQPVLDPASFGELDRPGPGGRFRENS